MPVVHPTYLAATPPPSRPAMRCSPGSGEHRIAGFGVADPRSHPDSATQIISATYAPHNGSYVNFECWSFVGDLLGCSDPEPLGIPSIHGRVPIV